MCYQRFQSFPLQHFGPLMHLENYGDNSTRLDITIKERGDYGYVRKRSKTNRTGTPRIVSSTTEAIIHNINSNSQQHMIDVNTQTDITTSEVSSAYEQEDNTETEVNIQATKGKEESDDEVDRKVVKWREKKYERK
ncbi:hypothetical protein CHS0354_030023 [Potamilus streckersoni]|uniref:Uncharacterized protein n=1 Tax=Potamilus streckersoni TaxID=2493646 RepID=A0AAE0VU99_9BIVA|nr:hypothetical protein CHS0354_030023 [Potamilus streckersoni]